jgi:hypothetical protein
MNFHDRFNVAEHFVERHLKEGRGDHIADRHGEERLIYRQIASW